MKIKFKNLHFSGGRNLKSSGLNKVNKNLDPRAQEVKHSKPTSVRIIQMSYKEAGEHVHVRDTKLNWFK